MAFRVPGRAVWGVLRARVQRPAEQNALPAPVQAGAEREALLARLLALGLRFRRSRVFVSAVVAVPVLALSGGGIAYATWDSTRVDVPDVVGAPWSAGIVQLERLGLGVDPGEVTDTTIDPNCYHVIVQDLAAGTRVVPDDTVVALEVEPDQLRVPNVVGMTTVEARMSLSTGCFHDEILPTWCVPEGFSGGEAALNLPELWDETGFIYNTETGHLLNSALTPDDEWEVCEQARAASTMYRSSLTVPLAITLPLTTVPQPAGGDLEQALAALTRTADDCELNPTITATFAADPNAIQGEPLPSAQKASTWQVNSLSPTVGHAVLCDSKVRVEVEWPSTPMPQLLGQHHVPETPTSATPTTAALESAGLKTVCTGRGTVTSQVPAAGAPVPVGTSVTCVAELVVPNIVGLDPTTANAVLVAAGLTGTASGSGIVVSQSPAAGSIATSSPSVSFTAQQPYVSSGSAYYENCTAARAAGAAPIYAGEPGYRAGLDRDGDGIACE